MRLDKPKGYTLIELMVVIAIVGILSVLAIASYRDYLVRSRVIEGLILVGPAKLVVIENASHASADLSTDFVEPAPTINVAKISLSSNGVATITFTAKAGGGTIILQPIDNNGNLVAGNKIAGSISWSCTGGTTNSQHRPASCR